jgi:hypothetical protein
MSTQRRPVVYRIQYGGIGAAHNAHTIIICSNVRTRLTASLQGALRVIFVPRNIRTMYFKFYHTLYGIQSGCALTVMFPNAPVYISRVQAIHVYVKRVLSNAIRIRPYKDFLDLPPEKEVLFILLYSNLCIL